ncbi:hypothetical protein EV715DRAFT_247436 [Schizophyllum commune]
MQRVPNDRLNSSTTITSNAAGKPSTLLMPTVRCAAPGTSGESVGLEWFGLPAQFEIVALDIELEGYQMYAVEKWIVERDRPVTVLVVYTGDPAHKITVTALRPSERLSPFDAQAQWTDVIHYLRRDGARAKETPRGVLMATSLAHFRSDYTIVHIPNGNFLEAKHRLYANINLLRMGCAGRSTLTLEEPTDSTKGRFIKLYGVPEKSWIYEPNAEEGDDGAPRGDDSFVVLTPPRGSAASPSKLGKERHSPLQNRSPPSPPEHKRRKSVSNTPVIGSSKSPALSSKAPTLASVPSKGDGKVRPVTTTNSAAFLATVLELVRIVQAALGAFGMYSPQYNARRRTRSASASMTIPSDGLLCDVTVEGIKTWVTEVGEPCADVEPTERIVDPTVVSCLLSLVLAMRNKLSELLGSADSPPKDPFLNYPEFIRSISMFAARLSSPHALSLHTSLSSISPNSAHASHTTVATHQSSMTMGHLPVVPITLSINRESEAKTVDIKPEPREVPVTYLSRSLIDSINTAWRNADDDNKDKEKDREKEREKDRKHLEKEKEKDRRLIEKSSRLTHDYSDGSASEGHSGHHLKPTHLIGNLARKHVTGGSISLGAGAVMGLGTSGGAGEESVYDPVRDLELFAAIVSAPESKRKRRERGERHRREDKDRERDEWTNMTALRAFWTGKAPAFATCVRARVELQRMKWSNEPREERDAERDGAEKEKSDGGDEVSGLERVQKKLGSWTGKLDLRQAKKRHREGNDMPLLSPSIGRKDSTEKKEEVLPSAYQSDKEEYYDDDLLSSGQASPVLGEHQKPMGLYPSSQARDFLRPYGSLSNPTSAAVSPYSSVLNVGHPALSRRGTTQSINIAEVSEALLGVSQRRKYPWGNRPISQTRVSSWSDPVSAKEIAFSEDESADVLDGAAAIGRKRRKPKTRLSQIALETSRESAGSSEGSGLGSEDSASPEMENRVPTRGVQRRRSFHDLESFRNMHVLTPDQMRIDVELGGHLLIMHRRQQHLQNVIACLQVLTANLSETSDKLRADYQDHLSALSDAEAKMRIVAEIEQANAEAEKIAQAKNTILYESAQFRLPDLWHIASPPRDKVFEYREKVFGTGGRRFPPGVRGAHGRFNRLQWTLDGKARAVDQYGRTESEDEEEERIDPNGQFIMRDREEAEEDVVEHPAMKPMWLLRLFTSWGTWRGKSEGKKEKEKEGAASSGESGERKVVASGSGERKEDVVSPVSPTSDSTDALSPMPP